MGEDSSYFYISSKGFLVLQDIWNEVMKHQPPYRAAFKFADVILWIIILQTRPDFLTSVLVAMDYFFRCQKSIFFIEKK